jgi:hypothetical protein
MRKMLLTGAVIVLAMGTAAAQTTGSASTSSGNAGAASQMSGTSSGGTSSSGTAKNAPAMPSKKHTMPSQRRSTMSKTMKKPASGT